MDNGWCRTRNTRKTQFLSLKRSAFKFAAALALSTLPIKNKIFLIYKFIRKFKIYTNSLYINKRKFRKKSGQDEFQNNDVSRRPWSYLTVKLDCPT